MMISVSCGVCIFIHLHNKTILNKYLNREEIKTLSQNKYLVKFGRLKHLIECSYFEKG